jgi:hypothetical protein
MYIVSNLNKRVNQNGSSLSLPAHGRAGARATPFLAAFLRSKNEIRRRKSEGGQKFLPPNPLPFCPPEHKSFSKFSVRIFAKKSSDFVQDRQPHCKVSFSCLARGFAPRFGGRIFKQFPNEPILFRPKGESKAAIYPPKADCPKAITNKI